MSGSDNSGGASAPPLSPVSENRYELKRTGNSSIQLGIRQVADVAMAKRLAEIARHKEQALGRRRGAEMVRIASLPMPTVKAIAAVYGIELINLTGRKDWTAPTQAEMKRLEQIIETDLPLLKTTEMRFNLKKNSVTAA